MKTYYFFILALLLCACSNSSSSTSDISESAAPVTPLASLIESFGGDNADMSDIVYLNKASDEMSKYIKANIGNHLSLFSTIPLTLKSKNGEIASFESDEESIANHKVSISVAVGNVPSNVMDSLIIGDKYFVDGECIGDLQPGYNNTIRYYIGTIPMGYTEGCINK